MTELQTTSRKTSSALDKTPSGFPGPTSALIITARSDSGTMPKQVLELIYTLKAMGLYVFVASPVNPPFGIEFKKIADRFIPIPHREFSFGAMMRVRKSIRKHHISIVHSHGRTAGIYSRLLGKLTHASIIHSYHGITNEPGVKGFFKQLGDQILSRFKYEPVFSSETEMLNALTKHVLQPKREAHVIDIAVDLDRYPKRKNVDMALSKVDPAKPETLVDIRVGAFLRPESTKGHELFLKIAQEAGSQAKFTCAGLTRAQLEKFGKIPPGLEILGPLADPSKWLYSLDVFVSTSTSDGQVGGSLEAMAAGAICLLSNLPAHEQFQKHNAVALFDPKSAQSFLSELGKIRSDRAVRDMLVGNSRYMIERFYDDTTYKNKILDLYRTAAKRALGLVL